MAQKTLSKFEETLAQQSEAKRLRRKAQSQMTNDQTSPATSVGATITPILHWPVQPTTISLYS